MKKHLVYLKVVLSYFINLSNKIKSKYNFFKFRCFKDINNRTIYRLYKRKE
jgi:hypothetical protein